MGKGWKRLGLLVSVLWILGACAPAAQQPAKPAGPTRVSVALTDPLETQDPYDHSNTVLYPFWCEVLGCMIGWDYEKTEPAPALIEQWHVENPTTWLMHVRKGVRFHDGSPMTAADIAHSIQRIQDHPKGRQRFNIADIANVAVVDDHTLRITTKEPSSELLDTLINVEITSKAQFDRGDDLARVAALGTGPYQLKEWVPSQRVVISKTPNWWGGAVQGPDEVVYRYIKEEQPRVTALLNGEVQIATAIPPQEADRLNGQPNTRAVAADSMTIMFLAMQPKPPFDHKLVRQAVAHAIDRDAIIRSVLLGYAERLDGPIGPGQVGYAPDLQPRYTYNVERAKQLLAQAGFPNGVDVELSTPIGFYTKDKEVAEAMVPMLTAAGLRARLAAQEFSVVWPNIQEGKVPFFYFGRGQVRDPGKPLSQYFETGVSRRIGYSNPQLDALFAKGRATFDPAERKKTLVETMSLLTDEAPAHFLWRYKVVWGLAKNVEFTPRPDEGVRARDIRLK